MNSSSINNNNNNKLINDPNYDMLLNWKLLN